MGTRADFYATDDLATMKAEDWLGSFAWDGHAGGVALGAVVAPHEAAFLANVAVFRERDDWSEPDQDGWPWPWETSATTDFVYVWDRGRGQCRVIGSAQEETDLLARTRAGEEVTEAEWLDPPRLTFPDMSEFKRAPRGLRSGLIVLRLP